MIKLGVNIDHVATLRQVRYVDMPDAPNVEPDILAAASACERAGAHGITVHLRADRRHIQDRDVFRLRDSIITKLNLEMGNTPDILETALQVLPDDVCLVPENRNEAQRRAVLTWRATSRPCARQSIDCTPAAFG
jgi:pyridoxine 5-phosphate synthase